MTQQGWISLHRKLEDNPIFQNEKALKIWIWLLFRANHEPNDVLIGRQLVHLKIGQFIFGSDVACEKLRMSKSTIHWWLHYMKVERYIERKTTNKYSVITVLNYTKYQEKERKLDAKLDAKRTPSVQPNETNNTVNTENKVLLNSNTVNNQYGNKYCNFVLEEFKRNVGINPIDSNSRNVAFNIYQLTSTFIKKHGEAYTKQRGQQATFTGLVTKAWEVYRKNNGDHLPQRLKTFKEHYKGMLEQLSISLNTV